MNTRAQRPRPCLQTLNGEDSYESLSTSIVAAGCKVLAELQDLNRKGWEDSNLDDHFQNWKKISAQPSTFETATAWFKTYCRSMHDMNRQMKFIPDGPLNFLDLGCAPGGYSKCVLEANPKAIGTGICLPLDDGGHRFMLPKYMRARYTVHYSDMTRYSLRKSYLEGYAPPLPFPSASFGLVIADGHPLHTREFNERVPHLLLVTQLIIALQAINEDGTIFIKLSKPASFRTACVLYLLDSVCSSLETIKPRTVHGNRGTFYTIARGVRRGKVLEGYVDILYKMRQEIRDSAFDLDNALSVYEQIITLARLKESYIARLIELGTPVWEVQRKYLGRFLRNKGMESPAQVEPNAENDVQADD
ncbi:hypothetical protein FRC01_003391 [Tulasnella sp. 417]|nr:hypothetical protein FRC01_003391 [Tulasnella sp. 417]